MMFGAPQAIYTALIMIGIGVALARFGQPKRGTYDIIDALIGPVITVSLLYWGGFYG